MACVCVTHHSNNCHIMPPTDTPWHQLTYNDTNRHIMTPTDTLWHQLTRHVTNWHMTLTDTWHMTLTDTWRSLTHDTHWRMTLTDTWHSLTNPWLTYYSQTHIVTILTNLYHKVYIFTYFESKELTVMILGVCLHPAATVIYIHLI